MRDGLGSVDRSLGMFMRKGRLSFVWTGSVLIEAFFLAFCRV